MCSSNGVGVNASAAMGSGWEVSLPALWALYAWTGMGKGVIALPALGPGVPLVSRTGTPLALWHHCMVL